MQGSVNYKDVNYYSVPLIGFSAIPGSCVVLGINQGQLECWDRGFESRLGLGYSSLVFFM